MQNVDLNLSAVNLKLTEIRPSSSNPRRIITADMIRLLAASIQAAGLKNPIKVRKVGDCYEIISGHIRFEAAKSLGWETISAIVLDLDPEQALLMAVLDNRGQQMTWFDLNGSIEALLNAPGKIKQAEIAAQLEVTDSTVTRAKNMMGLLNEAARDRIFQNLKKSETYQIPENVVVRLTDLEKGSQKDPKELQFLIDRALKVALDNEMTEPVVGRMVAWVLKTGREPEGFFRSSIPRSPLMIHKPTFGKPSLSLCRSIRLRTGMS